MSGATLRRCILRVALALTVVPATGSALSGDGLPEIPGAKVVSFKQLSNFAYVPSGAEVTTPPQIPYPPDVLALQGQRVAVRGYLLPMDFDQKGIIAFFLMARPDQGCCFGSGLALNEWIDVRWKGKPLTKFNGTVPVTVIGTLDVKPDISGGAIGSLYHMEGVELREEDQ